MRLAITLLVLAALASFAAVQLRQTEALPEPVVAARRAQHRAPAPAPRLEAAPAPMLVGPPLFRRAQESEAQTQEGERFTLVGLADAPGAPIALLRDKATGAVSRVHSGDQIGEWSVVGIDDACVRLRRRRESQSVCLR